MTGIPMSQQLADLALGWWSFHLGPDGEPYALPLDGPAIAVPLRGVRGVRSKLASMFRDRYSRPPSQAALADALQVLEGESQPDARPVALRVASTDDGARWLDLGHPNGEVVKIADGTWTLTTTNQVVFRRTALTGQLPTPMLGGDLEVMREFVNVSDADWPLLVALLVSALDPDMPHPIGAVTGEQGTGKSTTVRRIVELIDPSPAPLRSSPRDLEQWSVAASGSWMVALDNVSRMPEWLSDALCRAATGDGFVRRRLYSDADVSVLAFRRVVMLTYIDAGALRGDLADRLVTFDLDRISRRRTDAELNGRWHDLHWIALGGLLDIAAQAFDRLDRVDTGELGRMADYHRIVAAVDNATGWSGAARYANQGDRIAEEVVAGDPVAEAVVTMMAGSTAWSGTAADLLGRLEEITDGRKLPRTWPANARAMGAALKRCAPALRRLGIGVDGPHPVGRDRQRTYFLSRDDGNTARPSAPSAPSADAADADGADGTDARSALLSSGGVDARQTWWQAREEREGFNRGGAA